MHRDSTGFIAVGFAGGTVTFHPDSVCAPRYTFHFPRDEQDADGHSAGTASSGLCWWAILLAVALDIARRLLRATDLSVGDIATKTGFATTKYFSAAFKDAFGMSPNEFRAQ